VHCRDASAVRAIQVLMMLDDSEPVKFAVGESYVDLDQAEGWCLWLVRLCACMWPFTAGSQVTSLICGVTRSHRAYRAVGRRDGGRGFKTAG
jgi:hypothetical protein